jgi:gamma-glutamyltranspeptidase/glutathione hydrolase
MRIAFPRHPTAVLAVTLAFAEPVQADAEAARLERGIVATVHPLATDAAIGAFRNGGNAIDASVAAALTLGIVDGHNSGIGGGCFLLIRLADGQFAAIDGRETAPGGATRDMFVRDGKAEPELSLAGPLAAGVPGALAAYDYALRRYGRISLKELLLAAAKIAERGFPISRHYAERLAASANELNKFEPSRAAFLPDGATKRAGAVLRLPDLGNTYRAIAEHGPGWFYGGPFAATAADWMKSHGGLLTVADFRGYHAKMREPVFATYRGFQLVGFPPPSSGGIHVAQILNVLEHFDLESMGPGSADLIHVVTEAMKLAFADRSYWLGDPDFTKVPRGLVAKDYAARLAKQIRMDRTAVVPQHGTPESATEDVFQKHTTHFSTADAEGNWVACTATINTSFGCKVVVPGTGVVLNNQMDDFSAQPGATNYFGLIGAEANAIAPGKRPLSSMSPTIVLKDGKPILAVGAAGGPTIISQTVLAIINTIDFHMDPATALAQPRFHHQWKPDELIVEKGIGENTLTQLEQRGHKLKRTGSFGAAQAVGVNAAGRGFLGAHDPRVEGKAAGW